MIATSIQVQLSQIREGSAVMVQGDFGTAKPQIVTVVAVCDDVKNGRPGIEYVTKDGDESWAYLTQVVLVVKK